MTMNDFMNTTLKTIQGTKSKQIVTLYFSMILVMLLGLGISIANTRLLGVEHYGDYKFLEFLFTFVATITTMGFFMSGSRLIAQRRHDMIQPELVGGILMIAGIISLAIMAGVFVFSFFEEAIFNNKLGGTIRLFSLLLFVFPVRMCLGPIMQGKNQILKLSLYRIMLPATYLTGLLIYCHFYSVSLVAVLSIRYGAFAAVICLFIYTLKPSLRNLTQSFSIIWKENVSYGFHVHVGTLANIATAQLGGLLVGYFANNTSVGFFGLALTAATPLCMMPSVVGTTFFKHFTNTDKIPVKAMVVTTIITIASLGAFLLLIEKVVLFFYPAEFAAVIPLSRILAVGFSMHGMGEFFVHFLRAHGRGKELRNISLLIGLINIIGYPVLVYFYKASGAAFARVLVGIVYLAVIVYYYVEYTAKPETTTSIKS